ncbi:MAG: hypothetical protein HKP41_18205 [Desulfobacterales bacterium]|nr:hypothetical protein [Desulfobacterales bacterium]
MAGQCAIAEYGVPVPEQAIASIRKNKVALKGPMTNVVGTGFPSPNITLRVELDIICKSGQAMSLIQGYRV